MKQQSFEVDKNKFEKISTELFLKYSGLDREGTKFDRMKTGAMAMLDAVRDKLSLKCKYAFYNKEEFCLANNKLTFTEEKKTVTCKAFNQIKEDSLEGVYLYTCTAGDLFFPQEDVLSQVYADLWGTAFIDAVRILIKDELSTYAKLSDSFGPGFYGMNVMETHNVMETLKMDDMGMKVKENGLMLPLKSCCGIYFAVNDRYEPLNKACESCHGNYTSCRICRAAQR